MWFCVSFKQLHCNFCLVVLFPTPYKIRYKSVIKYTTDTFYVDGTNSKNCSPFAVQKCALLGDCYTTVLPKTSP